MIAGGILVALTLLDTFFTVLNYNQRGLMFNRLISMEWSFLHWLFRPLKLKTRNHIYKVMTGFVLLSGILLWVSGMVFGFALIYMGLMDMGALKIGQEAPIGFLGALYFSIGQFSTVGVNDILPDTNLANILSVSEAMFSVLLLSLVITYLANVFSSIEDLRTYCACFPSASAQVDSPLLTLQPYLPQEYASDLETHLGTTRQAMNAYFDSVAADHSAIYFNSGKSRFIMPFALFSTAETIEGLKWGLGAGHPMSKLPELTRIDLAFEANRRHIYDLFRWDAPKSAEPMGEEEFIKAAIKAAKPKVTHPLARPGLLDRKPLPVRVAKNFNVAEQKRSFRTEQFESPEEYVKRFVRLRQIMTGMAKDKTPTDWSEEYENYVSWLNQAAISDDFIRRTSRLFDYRPVVEIGPYSSAAPLALYGWQSEEVGAQNHPAHKA